MDVLRTQDQRFARMLAYPYAVRTMDLAEGRAQAVRMAYVSAGAHENRPVVLLHGGPSWSYLWRQVIPSLVEGGCRVVAPDLIGFGRSEKPKRARDLTRERQLTWLRELCTRVDVAGAVLVCHGTSALLGFELCAAMPGRFGAVAAVSPMLAPTEEGAAHVARFRATGQAAAGAGELVAAGCASPLADTVRAAYDAPFPDREHAAAVRALHGMMPRDDDWSAADGAAAAARALPLVTVTGEADTLSGGDGWLARLPPSERAHETVVVPGAGHYVPEDRGPELALAILSFMATAR